MTFRDARKVLVSLLLATGVLWIARADAQGTFYKPTPTAPTAPQSKPPKHKKPSSGPIEPAPAPQPTGTDAPSGIIAGRVENTAIDGSIFVSGRLLKLEGMTSALLPPEEHTGFINWINRNGGTVTCKPSQIEADAYTCDTPSNLNLSLALAINGAMLGDRSVGRYAVARAATNAKYDAVKDDPAFAIFLAGDAILDCQSPLSCGAKLNFGGSKANSQLYAQEDWVGLVKNVIKIGYKSDVEYFYLGRAAQGLLDFPAAIRYYERAAELHRSNEGLDHCAGPLTDAACGSVDLDQEIASGLSSARRMAAYSFQ